MKLTLLLNRQLNMVYSSYYIYGFYQLSKAKEIELKIRSGFAEWGIDLTRTQRASQLFQCCTFFEVQSKSAMYRVALDLGDAYTDIDPHILDRVDVLYKSNYNPDWIRNNLTDTQASKIRPAGLFFPLPLPTILESLFSYKLDWASGWALQKKAWLSRLYKQGGLLKYRISLRQMREWRHLNPTQDIFFNCTAWANPEKRNGLINRLKNMPIKFNGGFVPTKLAREKFPENTLTRPVPHRDYMHSLATSGITINTNGKHDCLAWKLPEQLALGKFILSEKPVNTLPYELEDGVHIVFLEDGFADLEDKVLYYLNHPDEAQKIAANGARLFDEQIVPEQICQRILSEFC